MSIANLFLRFVLELGAVAAAGYSGYELAAGAGPFRWLVGMGAALAIIVVWAIVVAPKMQNGLSPLRKERIGTVIMLATAAALALAGQPTIALGFGTVIVVNVALLAVFGRDAVAGVIEEVAVFGRDALDQLMGVTS